MIIDQHEKIVMQTSPNAVLVVDEQQEQDIAIVELFNLVYDVNKKALKYDIVPDNSTSAELPNDWIFYSNNI
ncbi:MAG: hypothetical protein ACPKQO_11420 [Nitrososphaeraceae archaeon]